MGRPVVTVASGGLPVVDATAFGKGTPVTEDVNLRGLAVTKVANLGMPVCYETIGSAFSPLTGLTGLIGWWDASVTASLTRTGNNITNIADQSGAGNHLGDGTTGTPYTLQYNATGLNSRPTMTAALGSNQAIRSTGTFPMGTGNTLTFFIVGILNTGGGPSPYGRLLDYLASGASQDFNNNGSFAVAQNNGTASLLFVRNAGSLTPAMSYAAPHRIIGTVNSSGAMTLYIDGVATSGATQAGNWVSNGYLRICGEVVVTTNYWNGAVSEVGVATGYSDATTVGQLDTYLKNKWGL